ncbi:dethiobiotin synthase [Akkermansiaceae bacterium]|nr:dethiobiotin synthase [Akkermansiaceae bacterium]MDA7888440.1 dethiobiotin synthase [Akkermansiaceae bacterium]MDB4537495.1 dethiobiotin synthase [Akkermansiaceae bacterium]
MKGLGELRGVFVTGTDTGIGKTYVSALIVEELRKKGISAVGLKPVCSGSREDAGRLWEASGGVLDLNVINPSYYQTPVAPLVAGRIEGSPLELDEMIAQIREVEELQEFTLVEGAGGWEVPLGEGFGIPDLAKELGYPVIVVVANWLGAINHTLLTVKAIESRGVKCLGVILNHLEAERDIAATTNRLVLEEALSVPILGEVLTDGTEIDWR